MKAFRGTFIFTVLVIAACLFSYFQVFKKGNEEKEQKEKETQLYKVKIDDVTRIEMHRTSETIVLDKKGDNWFLAKPIEDKADASVVKSFLESLLREKTSSEVEGGETADLKVFGLDQPSFKIKLISATQPKGEEVSFGSVKAYDGSEYIQFSNQKKIFLASSYLGATLNKKSGDFRNKNLYTTAVADVDHIKILGSETIELKRDKSGWSMLQPKSFDLPISSEAIQTFLDQVRNMKGTDIVSDRKELAPYRLNHTPHSLQIHRAQEPQDFEMKISEPKSDKDQIFFATSTDVSGVLKIAPASVDIINKRAFDFTNKNYPFAFQAKDAQVIKINTSDLKIELKKEAAGWKNLDSASSREINSAGVDRLVEQLSHLEADSLTHAKTKSNLNQQISIANSKGEDLLQMKWGDSLEQKAPTKKYLHASTNKISEPIILQQTQIDSLGLKDIFKATEVKLEPASQPTPRNGAALDGAPPLPEPKKDKK